MRAVVFAVGLLAPSPSRADEPPPGGVSIEWTAPAECPSQPAVTGQVEHFLGQRLSERNDQKLVIVARVTTRPSAGYAADLTVQASTGTYSRHLEHDDCARLTEAAALVMALAIDPERVQLAQSQPSQPEATPPENPAPAAAPAVAPAPARLPPPPPPRVAPAIAPRTEPPRRQPRRKWVLSVTAVGLAGTGVGPSIAPGLGVDAAADRDGYRLALGARHWFRTDEPVPGFSGARVLIDATSIGARGCVLPATGDWTLGVCAGLEAGEMSGSGDGVTDPRGRTDVWSAALAGVGVGFDVAHWAILVAGVEGGVNVLRPRFGVLVDGTAQEVYRPGVWTARGLLGLGGRF